MTAPFCTDRSLPTITEQPFDIGRFALPNRDDRVRALDEFMSSAEHCTQMSSWLQICIPRGDVPSLGDLYMALRRVLTEGPVRFRSCGPDQMRRYWYGMLLQHIGFLKGTACRSASRYRKRFQPLVSVKKSKASTRSDATDRDPPDRGPDLSADLLASSARLDSAPSTVDAARQDLAALVVSMEHVLNPAEHARLRALVRLVDVTGRVPSQREVAREVGCSKSSISNLLAKIRELALDDVRLRWCQSTRS